MDWLRPARVGEKLNFRFCWRGIGFGSLVGRVRGSAVASGSAQARSLKKGFLVFGPLLLRRFFCVSSLRQVRAWTTAPASQP